MLWAPTINDALVVTMRGGDFHPEVAHDLALGYVNHDATDVELIPTETIGSRLDSDDAAVVITSAG